MEEMIGNRQLDHSAHSAQPKKYPICFLAHDIDIPMNIGSFFRIADALGVEKIYLTGTSITPPHPKIKKTSRSTEQYIAYRYEPDPMRVLGHLKQSGYQLIGLEITSTSVDIASFKIEKNQKICLILGSENYGICQKLLDACDATVHIPMLGRNSSMNVAHACSIATYELRKQLTQREQSGRTQATVFSWIMTI